MIRVHVSYLLHLQNITESLRVRTNFYPQSRRHLGELPRRVQPVVRHPADVPDLLTHKLVSGFSSGDHHDH